MLVGANPHFERDTGMCLTFCGRTGKYFGMAYTAMEESVKEEPTE